MKILVVCNRPAWPLFPGFQLRAGMTMAAISQFADVDVIQVLDRSPALLALPPGLEKGLAEAVPVSNRRVPEALLRWTMSRLPMPMVKVHWGAASGVVAEAVERHCYDLVWAIAGTAWPIVAGVASSLPVLLDLDDLENHKIRHRQAAQGRLPRSPSAAFFRIQDMVDRRRWDRVHADALTRCVGVTVCSAIDVARLNEERPAGSRAVVAAVPNGYVDPGVRQGPNDRDAVDPYLSFVGDLAYRPNAEAVEMLAEVMPVVREQVPRARLRVVGNIPDSVAARLAHPSIEFVGRVPDIRSEILGATASVSPLRSGGGTRIKILEAFAYGVAVVSTSVGAEGIDATPGRHLLVEDTVERFAAACVEMLRNAELRERVASAGHSLYEANYTAEGVRIAVGRVLSAVTM